MKKDAKLSEDGVYRFQLSRIWDESKPNVLFIMHNPSTADASEDDPTIRRCIGFAKYWGFGGIYVGNYFPFRATLPTNVKMHDSLVELANTCYIKEMADKCELHIIAHGNPALPIIRPMRYNDNWHYLKLTKTGNPCHPLYLKGDLIPKPFNKSGEESEVLTKIKKYTQKNLENFQGDFFEDVLI